VTLPSRFFAYVSIVTLTDASPPWRRRTLMTPVSSASMLRAKVAV
jgi:hypothetical protein